MESFLDDFNPEPDIGQESRVDIKQETLDYEEYPEDINPESFMVSTLEDPNR